MKHGSFEGGGGGCWGGEWRADEAVHSIRWSGGGNPPSVNPSSEQQRASREQLTRHGRKYRILNVSRLTSLALGRPTAPGCLCLWGTLSRVGGRPPSLPFFFFSVISSVRSSRPRPSLTHSNRTPPQPDDSTEPGPCDGGGGRGGARSE